MRYGSVCSGIEAASVAWESLGWQAQWYSEIEHFPSAVLAHRFPTVPNLGDMTQIHNSEHFNGTTIDLLVGGTPCQSFSVAGLRKGLDDTRGQLMLTFCELAARKRPKWVVWENVPGVLSSNKGEDLASFLGLLTGREVHPPVGGWKNSGVIEGIDSAYGVAWTVLDAQYFGVAQRRRRIFAVGYLGDWRPAAAVLFESYRLSGDIKESRKKRKATPSDAQGGSGGSSSWWNGEQTAATLTKQNANGAQRMPDKDNLGAVLQPVAHAFKVRGGSETETGEQGGTPGKKAGKGYLGSDELAFTIGTAQDQQIAQPIAYEHHPSDSRVKEMGDTCTTVTSKYGTGGGNTPLVAQPIAYSFDSLASNSMKSSNPHSGCREVETSKTLDTTHPNPSKNQGGIAIAHPIAVDVYNQSIDGQTAATITEAVGGSNTSGPKVAQPSVAGFLPKQGSRANGIGWAEEQSPTLRAGCDTYGVVQPIAVDTYNYTTNESTTQTIRSQNDTEHIGAVLTSQNISPTITQCKGSRGGSSMEALDEISAIHAQQPTMAIRRLTPTECERLQGFPDGWTKIPYRNKPEDVCPDGPRYKACGNSMAVPVMAWIGRRIQMVQDILDGKD